MNFPNIPPIAKGTVLSDSVQRKLLEEENEKNAIKKQHRHDFIVATYSAIIAAIVSTLIGFLLQIIQ